MSATTTRPLPGGPLAIGLLNTIWRTSGAIIDWLEADGAVEEFTLSWGHTFTTSDLDAVRVELVKTRALVRRLLSETTDTEQPLDQGLVAELNTALACSRAIIRPDGPTLLVSSDEPANALAIEALVNAIELRRDRAERVRICEHEDCVLWFLDTSKGGRRRWCSMERCGNRTKAHRHHQRSAQSAS